MKNKNISTSPGTGTDITILADALIQVERKRVELGRLLGEADISLYIGPNNEELCDLIFDLIGLFKESDSFCRDGAVDLFYELLDTPLHSMDILEKLIGYKEEVSKEIQK